MCITSAAAMRSASSRPARRFSASGAPAAPKTERIKRTAAEIAAGIPLADVPACRASGLSPDAFKARKYAAPEPTKTPSPASELAALAQELGTGYDPEPEPDVSSQPWAGILYGNAGIAQPDDVSEAEVIF